MEQSSSWKADRFSTSEEIPRVLRNPTKPVYYVLTLWIGVLLEKLAVSQLSKKFLAFYGIRGFITEFTKAGRLSLFTTRLKQAHAPSQVLKIHFNIILPSRPKASKLISFPQVSPPKHCVHLYGLPYCHMPCRFHSSEFQYSWHWCTHFCLPCVIITR